MKDDALKSKIQNSKLLSVQWGNETPSGHMCALLVYSLTSSGNTGISRALFARAHLHVHIRTLSGRTASWFPQQQASTCLPSLSSLAPPPHSKPTHTFMPLIPLFLILPHAPCKESIETQSVFLMSAPARRSLAAAASLISSAATCADAFHCALRGNTVTRETRDPFQPTNSSPPVSKQGNWRNQISNNEIHCIDGGRLQLPGFSLQDNQPSKRVKSSWAGLPMLN